MISSLPIFIMMIENMEIYLLNKLLVDVDLNKNRNKTNGRGGSRYDVTKTKEDLALEAAEYFAVHLGAPRHRQRFFKILEIGRDNRRDIKYDKIKFKTIMDERIDNGDNDLLFSHKLGRCATKLKKIIHYLVMIQFMKNDHQMDVGLYLQMIHGQNAHGVSGSDSAPTVHNITLENNNIWLHKYV